MTLGSLFDGSGGFPLAGLRNGITPVWSSEIEPYPLKVTAQMLPDVVQLGDIRQIDGSKIQPVDIITFGSPCQDMSYAKYHREGLAGSRSNLFYEAVRIIEEMRDATEGRYPKYVVWENVLGAKSSNGGRDFRAVLEALCQVAERDAHVPQPEKWGGSGYIVGNGYSVAWRTYNAEFWGVPQHRRRLYLVASYTDESAGKILFESESSVGDSEKSESEKQTSSRRDKTGSGSKGRITGVLTPPVALDANPTDSRIRYMKNNVVPTLTHRMGTGGNQVPLLYDEPVYSTNHGYFQTFFNKDTAGALAATDFKDPPVVGLPERGIIRRLTPLECCRLQGFPDEWDSVEGTDAQKYRMWGNGIALPCAVDVLRRLKKARKEWLD